MKVKAVRGFKPGVYTRRQIVYEGIWVDVSGFLFLPVGHGARKWWGPALVKRVSAPVIVPREFVKHDQDTTPQVITYSPLKGLKMEFSNHGRICKVINEKAEVTFRL